MNQRWIIKAGQDGLQVRRLRVRYEDNQEVSQQIDAEWVAIQPKKEIRTR